jgi:DHA3 family macrolide efflux protein-like MFS transporter
MQENKRPSGMFGFVIVWIGQLISLLGTNMSAFALTIWAYKLTGSATALALVGFFFVTPMLIISPLAGAIVDRSNRKLMMMVSDLASGLATIAVLILYTSGRLEIWQLYITGAIQGVFQAFQWPAYSAAITTMLPKEQYGRANGLLSLAESGSNIFSPLLAGALLGVIGLVGILSLDIFSFIFAIGALLVVRIPQPRITEEGRKGRGSLLKESAYGFSYILERPSLLGLQIVFLLGNFFHSIPFAILAPLILASTGNNEISYATVTSAGAIGAVVGGVAMSAWGGPKKRVNGVLTGWILNSLLGLVLLGVGRSLPAWVAASFMGAFFIPIINGSNQAIWQAKVAPDVQGRVFSIRRLIAWFVTPISLLIAGPLADRAFEPAMKTGGVLSATFAWLVGNNPGAGMALIFILCGLLATGVGISGYLVPVIRDAETLLPDQDTLPAAGSERHNRLQSLLQDRSRLLTGAGTPEQEAALKRISQELRELGAQSSEA